MGKTIAIVAGQFHKDQTEKMVAEALVLASQEGLQVAEVVWVPGAFEYPLTVKRLFQKKEIDGAVVFGIIERGETKNGLAMGQAVFSSLLQIQLETMKPIGMGIIGPEVLPDQISSRTLSFAHKAIHAVSHMLNS